MPVYEFMDDEGELHEQFFFMQEAPRIGEAVTLDGGIAATRIASLPQQKQTWQPYTSNRLPRWMEGCHHTPSGKPIIESQQQENEIKAKLGMERE